MFFIAKTPQVIALKIPTLNDHKADFIQMFSLRQQIESKCASEFIFDFSKCSFLRQNAVAFLSGLARLIEVRGGCAIIACETLQDSIRTNLTQNGFLYTLAKIEKDGGEILFPIEKILAIILMVLLITLKICGSDAIGSK